MEVYVIFSLAIILTGCTAQPSQEFVFPWIGPITVPVNNSIVQPPDTVRIELADNASQRVLRIREEVDVTIDCTRVVESLINNNLPVNISELSLTWYLRQLSSDLMTLEPEQRVAETPPPIIPDEPAFIFNGSLDEMLLIQGTNLPTQAVEGRGGDYRCEVCINFRNICQDSVVTVDIRDDPPVIAVGPEIGTFIQVGTDIGRPVYNISNDFCILPSMPEQFFIDCYHDTSFPIRPDPAPEAVWTLNGISQPDNRNTFLQDEPSNIGTNDRLQIFSDGDINDILGTYVCVLSNAFGSDTATTVVTKCCEESDIPVINGSSGFVQTPQDGVLIIGQSTCLGSSNLLTIECPLLFELSIDETTYTWTKNGVVVIAETNSSLNVSAPGEYVCIVSSRCGSNSTSSVIYISPVITSFTGTIVGVTGDGCDRDRSPTGSDLCPVLGETVTVSCDTIDPYSILGPNRTISNGPLLINSINAGDEGRYTCIAENICGVIQSELTIMLGDEREVGVWMPTPWSVCEPDCQEGNRTREVRCVGTDSGTTLPEDQCTETKPHSMEQCTHRGPCQREWVTTDWSSCSKNCDCGERTRDVFCQVSITKEIVNDSMCSGSKPIAQEYCNLSPCCTEDLYPAQCKFVAGSEMCAEELYKDICCCSCRMGLSYIQ